MDMVSNFRLKTLDPVQFPAIQTYSKKGTGEKRSGTENRTALLGECCHPKKLSTKKPEKNLWLSNASMTTHLVIGVFKSTSKSKIRILSISPKNLSKLLRFTMYSLL